MKEVPGKSGFQKGKIRIKAEWEWLFLKDMECKKTWNYEIWTYFVEQQKKSKKNTLKECNF